MTFELFVKKKKYSECNCLLIVATFQNKGDTVTYQQSY